ncbi:MAG: hypothetical protein LBG43_04120 [Treponema sp.]|nr:hypothetical protein [Treponema sp.]
MYVNSTKRLLSDQNLTMKRSLNVFEDVFLLKAKERFGCRLAFAVKPHGAGQRGVVGNYNFWENKRQCGHKNEG